LSPPARSPWPASLGRRVPPAQTDRGVSTEVAAFATYLLGALCRSDAELAIGLAVVMVGLLAAKAPIHPFAREIINAEELDDALRFFVIAFVISRYSGTARSAPTAFSTRPRLSLLVVVLTGIGWVG